MTVIIDSSALVAYLLEESDFEGVRDILPAGLFAPTLLVVESSNAILQADKRGRIDRKTSIEAIEVLHDLVQSNIRLHPDEDLVHDAFRMAVDHGLAIYDSIFLALAQKLNGSLISRDRKQIEAARKLGIEVLGA